ncbi:MAG TPA: hypothetical protein VLO11_04415, partial [Luteolibacter sp.]|nr:hypothetical protein [Luteolibacter sp.]
MKKTCHFIATGILLASGPLAFTGCGNDPITNLNAASVNPRELAAKSRASLQELYRINPVARKLGGRAKGILVFPEVTK